MDKSKVTSISVVVLILVGALSIGLFVGKTEGEKKGITDTENKLAPLVKVAFPEPLAEIKTITGSIKGIYGATIDLEIIDPDDYLPHTDGTSQKKEIKYVYVTSATDIFLVDVLHLDGQGDPKQTKLKLSDLKAGNAIVVTTNENTRNVQKFDATKIELIRY